MSHRLRVLMLSKACIVGLYQRKLEAMAALGIDLLTLVPPSWKDERGETRLERVYTQGYRLQEIPIALNGNFHLHWYPTLGDWVSSFRPQIVHIDEEPYNLAAWHALIHARRIAAKTLFFTWQNINRSYPIPFRWGEHWMLRTVDHALAGTESAAEVWRQKGYPGPLTVIPQFGIDPQVFAAPADPAVDRPFTIGYVGRLVPEKGIHLLLEAVAGLQADWRLRIIGSGPSQAELRAQAARLGIAERVEWVAWVASTEMPAHYRTLDVLAIPSLTRPNWKEQFGRVIIESMASGIPVVGSDSGAIPHVIGPAGVIVPEGDTVALRGALQQLHDDPVQRRQLGSLGQERAAAHFTHQHVAQSTVAVYHQMMG
jgi:glycosyltransferase involved in cell wall biosynthesis